MKKNFLVTTGLIDTWELHENNFILGKWCEFYEFDDFDKEKLERKIPKKINIIKNTHHWVDLEKQIKDHEYLRAKTEYLLEIISEKLSTIHHVNEDKEYWRVVIFNWLILYTTSIFDKWESIRVFFEKNKNNKFYSNFISLNDLNYIPKDSEDFIIDSQKDRWNHLIFLRLFHFLNIQNLTLIEKKITGNKLEKEYFKKRSLPLMIHALKFTDNIISKFAFIFNKIILDGFYFPKKEYLKICLRCKLIPSKYSNFFDFDIQEKSLSKDNERIELKNLLLKVDTQDKFIQFFLLNLHKDIPKSYLENFDAIKKKLSPFSKKKKIIFSMYSIYASDNFKIYLAETKKVGSKYIHVVHGGGLVYKHDARFQFIEKISDKIIRWNGTEPKQNIFVNLSPIVPGIKLQNPKIGNNCSIIYYDFARYLIKCGCGVDQSITNPTDFFNKLIHFVKKLNPEIKSKIKFRVKAITYLNYEKKFSEIFGKKKIDKVSYRNPLVRSILSSKLIIVTHPQTAFSEAMYSNIPTILIIEKNQCLFSKASLDTFNVLKKNKIAFEDFDEAKTHINKHWKELDLWWKSKNVQFARKTYLTNFFNVKPDWYREWSDYIYFSKKL